MPGILDANYIARPFTLPGARADYGSLYDRGRMDSYYMRGRRPHWYPRGSYKGPQASATTRQAIAEYNRGYDDNEREGDFKDYGEF